MVKPTEYELERDRKIAANKKLLEELGLSNPEQILPTRPKPPPKPKTATNKRTSNKRKNKSADGDGSQATAVGEDEENGRPRKTARREGAEDGDGKENVKGEEEDTGAVRRSSRVAGKKAIDYRAVEDGVGQDRSSRSFRVSKAAKVEMDTEPRDSNKRTQSPKQYGSIPGIEVGTWWETRQACSADAIHAPWVGGIAVGPKGAYSVALSGGYDDDVDIGEGFTYTGSGGRDLKGTKDKPKNLRTAPQSSDQTFENNFNRSLQLSSETKKPIRVIRGFKLQSPFAPSEGYRYDGLYTVEKAWREPGNNPKGYLVCKYAFKRVPGQPPLPIGGGDEDDDNSADETDEDKTCVSPSQETEESSTQVDADDE